VLGVGIASMISGTYALGRETTKGNDKESSPRFPKKEKLLELARERERDSFCDIHMEMERKILIKHTYGKAPEERRIKILLE
jgi:hypothetical protein